MKKETLPLHPGTPHPPPSSARLLLHLAPTPPRLARFPHPSPPRTLAASHGCRDLRRRPRPRPCTRRMDHWRSHKNGDAIPIREPPLTRLVTLPRQPKLISVTRTIDVPEKYSFPKGFKRGENARIRRLKKYLLAVYGNIGQAINDHSYFKRYYEANVQICDGLQHKKLEGDMIDSAMLLDDRVQTALYLVSEIVAVGGEDYMYVPPQLAESVVFKGSVAPKSMAQLALPTKYFPEHKYPIPPGVQLGGNMVDNYTAHHNSILRKSYEILAFHYNRLNFLLTCDNELREKKYYAGLYDRLWAEYDSVFSTIRCMLQYLTVLPDHPSKGEIFSFPRDLKEAVEEILSKEPTSSSWQEKKKCWQMEEKLAQELKEKEKKELERRQREEREEKRKQHEEVRKQREEVRKQREEVRKQREEAKKQREESARRQEESESYWEELKRQIEVKKAMLLQKKQVVQRTSHRASEAESDEDDESDADGEKPSNTPKKGPLEKSKPAPKKQKISQDKSDSESSKDKSDSHRERPANISLEEALSSASKSLTAAREASTLHMGNVPWNAKSDDVKCFFEDAGVVDVRFPTHIDGSRRGFCFVEFISADAASKALKDKQSKELLGRKIVLNLAKLSAQTPQSSNRGCSQKPAQGISNSVYIRGFDKHLAVDKIRSALEQHFGECGEITRVFIPTDNASGRKGFAFIDFKDQNSVSKALELNGSDIGGGNRLHVAKARGNVQPDGGGISGDRSGGRDGGRGRGGGRFGDHSFS